MIVAAGVLGVALLSVVVYVATDNDRINHEVIVPRGVAPREPVRTDPTTHGTGGLDLETGPAKTVVGAPPAPPATDPSPAKVPASWPLATKPKEPASSPVVAKTNLKGEFQPLFNGKDLTGWVACPGQPGQWHVENGILTASGGQYSALWTVRNDYRDFHLRVEARINESGDSGVFFRLFNSQGSYQAQLVGNPRTHLAGTGSLYSSTGIVLARGSDWRVSPGQWFLFEVIADRDRIVTKVNGKTAANYIDANRPPRSGPLGLEHDRPTTVVEFRKIEIRELNGKAGGTNGLRAAPAQTVGGRKQGRGQEAGTGLVIDSGLVPLPVSAQSLFNGSDLTGWAFEQCDARMWRVENHHLVAINPDHRGRGAKGLGRLLTERSFGEFIFRFEYQASSDFEFAAVWWTLPGELPPMFRPSGSTVGLATTPSGAKVYANVNASELKGDDEWNVVELEATERLIRISVNGKETFHKELPKKPAEPTALKTTKPGSQFPRIGMDRRNGRVGFEVSKGTGRFRHIEIDELSPGPAVERPSAKPTLEPEEEHIEQPAVKGADFRKPITNPVAMK